MTNKVYTGTTTIEEHIDKLTELYGYKPPKQVLADDSRAMLDQAMIALGDAVIDTSQSHRKQSIEIQRLKREAGLLKD
jgi:hypothetical protein